MAVLPAQPASAPAVEAVRAAVAPRAQARTGGEAGRRRADTGDPQQGNRVMAEPQDTANKMKDGFSEKIVDPVKKAGEAMRASGARIAESGSTVGTRMIDQAETNAREAFAAMRAAAGAKDLSEVMKIQGDFLRDQGSRSMTQAREIGELIMQFGRDAVAPLKGDQ